MYDETHKVGGTRMSEDRYTHGHADAVLRSHRWRTAQNSAAYLLGYLRPGMTVLDVGCGPGTLTVDLARRVAPGAVLGVDVSESVVAEAVTYGAGIADAATLSVSFVAADFRTFKSRPANNSRQFQVVHAHQVLQHLREPVAALAAMCSLVQPGGLVAARDADYAGMIWTGGDERMEQWRALYLAVTQRNGAEANAGRHLFRWAREAGLDNVEYTTSTWTYCTPADRQWWASLWAERVTSSDLATQAVEYGLASIEDLAAMAEGWRVWALDPDSVFIVPHGEIVARVEPDH